jgi:hypothetical protein
MPYAPPQPPVVPPRNGLGTAGFVLGLVGMLFSFIPLIGVVAWPLVILGLIFSLLGYARTRSKVATNKGLAITGAVLSIIGLVFCVLYVAVFTKAASDVSKQASTVVAISYDAGGTAKDATVTYSTYSDSGSAESQLATRLPWHKSVTAKGLVTGGLLTVTAGADGGTVSCKVTVNGKVAKTATGSGAFSSATCSNF